MTQPRAHRRHQATFAALAASLVNHVEREHPPHTITPETPARRDAHPKHHGCVEATFTVDDTIPNDLQRGVFQPGKQYRALIRFSNAFKVRHDMDSDARGMAIKLMDVEGKRVRLPDLDGKAPQPMDEGALTQDFLLVTHSEFFAAKAAEFVDIVKAITVSKSNLALAVGLFRCFVGLRPPRFRWRALWALFRTFTVTPNPVFLPYFSQTPYRLGSKNEEKKQEWQEAKFCVRPLQRPSFTQRVAFWWRSKLYTVRAMFHKTRNRENFLRDALSEYLAARDARFEFCVQRRTHPDRMPLDDATRRWSQKLSPYVRVATICIPRNERHRDPQFVREGLDLGHRLSFSPWHAVEDHRPLGSINRARLFVYIRVSRTRSALNGTDARVPPRS